MRRFFFFYFIILLFITSLSFAHVEHYKKVRLLSYQLFLNDKLIGHHDFNFKYEGDLLYVNSEGNFKVDKLGVVLMDYKTSAEEVYKKNQLIKFNSKTKQNKKNKFANILIQKNQFYIDGSSFKGQVSKDTIIGSWWNHQIIKSSKQISPISGSVNSQKVKFLGKKRLKIGEKTYDALHFHFLSDDEKDLKKKKINIEVWYDEKTLLWIKSRYNNLGTWEYRLKKVING